MTKADKVKRVNQAISRSTVAVDRKARAEVLGDGRVEYSVETGSQYRIKVSFSEILGLLHGDDIRALKGSK